MHVYYDPEVQPSHPPPGHAQTEAYLAQRRARVDQNWEEWDDLDEHSSTGLVARLFKLKTWDPQDPEAPTCPPTLAFRGTDFDDMRDLAISARVGVGLRPVPPLTNSPTVLYNFRWILSMDPSIPDDATHDDVVNMGFTAIEIYRDQGTARAEMANFGIHAHVGIDISLDILGRENGDWLNNLYQGLGRRSRQYENAKNYGRQVVREKILSLPEKKLEITGHSLGGGLAAATCTVLDNEFPDVSIHAITFNAAGVNPATVAPASLMDGHINNFTVEDEMLTTVQSFTSRIPIVGSVFRLAERHINQTGMPPALGTTRVVHGVLPPGSQLGSAGAPNPQLFPIQDQTVEPAYTGDFPILTEIDGLLGGSASATQFGNRFLTWLNTNYRDRALASAPSTLGLVPIWRLYPEMARLLMVDMEPEIAALTKIGASAASYHGMNHVIAAYEHLYPDRS